MKNKTILSLTAINMLSAVVGISFSVAQARFFGATRNIEIYFAAFALIRLLVSFSQAGQLSEVLLPVAHQLKDKHGFIKLQQMFSVVINWIGLGSLFLIIIFYTISPFLIEIMVPGFSEIDKLATIQLFRAALGFFILEIIASFMATMLNAEEIFGKTELAKLINSIIMLVVLLVFFSSLGIWSMVIGLYVGKLVQLAIYSYFLYRHSFRYFLILKTKNFNHVDFFKTIGFTAVYTGSSQIYNIVLMASVSFLPVGTYAIYNYIVNIFGRLRNVFIGPIIKVFFTDFSKSFRVNVDASIEKSREAIRYVTVFSVALIILVLYTGKDALTLLWGKTNFSFEQLDLAYQLLLFSMVAVLITSVGGVFRKMGISFGYAKKLYIGWAVAQIITAISVYVLIKFLGPYGLVIIIPLNVLLLRSVCLKTVYDHNRNYVRIFDFVSLGKLSIILIFMTSIFFLIGNYFAIFSSNSLDLILQIAIKTVIAVAISILLAYILKLKELTLLMSKVKNRLVG